MFPTAEKCILTDYYIACGYNTAPRNSAHFSPGVLPWQRFVLITEGEGFFCPDTGKAFRVRKNDILYINTDASYYTAWEAGSSFCSVGIRLSVNRPFFNRTDSSSILLLSRDGSLNRSFLEAKEAYSLREPGAELLCGSKVLSLLYQLAQLDNRRHSGDRMYQSILYLEQHCEDHPDVSLLAGICGVSVPVFYRKFREHTGMNVTDYRYTVLFRRAEALLETGEKNVTETAAELGFNDIYYFSKLFTRYCGISPNRYRKGERTDSSVPEIPTGGGERKT